MKQLDTSKHITTTELLEKYGDQVLHFIDRTQGDTDIYSACNEGGCITVIMYNSEGAGDNSMTLNAIFDMEYADVEHVSVNAECVYHG